MEEDPCTCDFLFEMHDGTEAGLELDLKYQWFASEKGTTGFLPIEGAVTKVLLRPRMSSDVCLFLLLY